jgi:hypothetical protein
MTLTRLSAATFDLARASVRTDQPVVLDVTGDGQSTLRLVGPWASSVVVERDGVVVATVSPSGGAVSVTGDFSGHHLLRLVPQGTVSVLGARANAAASGAASLPETGGPGLGFPLSILAFGVASGGVARRLWTRRA